MVKPMMPLLGTAALALLLLAGAPQTASSREAGVSAPVASDISAAKRKRAHRHVRRHRRPPVVRRYYAPPPYWGYYYGDPYYPYYRRPYRFYAPAPFPFAWWW